MELNRNRVTGLDLAVAREVRAEFARRPDVSVSALALELGMRRATLSARTNGHVPFSPSLLNAIATRLGMKPSQLIARAEDALNAEGAS